MREGEHEDEHESHRVGLQCITDGLDSFLADLIEGKIDYS